MYVYMVLLLAVHFESDVFLGVCVCAFNTVLNTQNRKERAESIDFCQSMLSRFTFHKSNANSTTCLPPSSF